MENSNRSGSCCWAEEKVKIDFPSNIPLGKSEWSVEFGECADFSALIAAKWKENNSWSERLKQRKSSGIQWQNIEYPISFWANLDFENKGLHRRRLRRGASDKNLRLIDRFPRGATTRGAWPFIHSFIRLFVERLTRCFGCEQQEKGKIFVSFFTSRPSAGKRRN